MKRCICLIVVAILAISTIAQAGYSSGSCSGSLKVTYSGANFTAGHGWSSGSTRTISGSVSCSSCNYSGVYGWASGTVEYYIGRSGGTNCGTYSACGGSATLYTNSCNGPNATGSGSFKQYNVSSSCKNMGDHQNGWSKLGKGASMSGGYQIIGGESWSGGSGTLTASASGGNWYTLWTGKGSASASCGSGSSTSTTTTTSSSGSKTIAVRARGVKGTESIKLNVNNSAIATWTLTTSMATRTATTSSSGGCNVQYTNDADGMDVQVDYIAVNGSTRQAESQTSNTGVYQNSKCGGSNSEWLHCNGYIGFGNV